VSQRLSPCAGVVAWVVYGLACWGLGAGRWAYPPVPPPRGSMGRSEITRVISRIDAERCALDCAAAGARWRGGRVVLSQRQEGGGASAGAGAFAGASAGACR